MPRSKKKHNNEQLLIISAVILLILSAWVVFWPYGTVDRNKRSFSVLPPKIIGKASLIIDFGNGQRRTFEGEIVENETLKDILIQASRAGDFSYELNKKSDLASIGNLAGVGKKYWHWYINGNKISKPFNEINVKSDDNILIKYE